MPKRVRATNEFSGPPVVDWAAFEPCQRCEGHADGEGRPRGGILPGFAFTSDGRWLAGVSACRCEFGQDAHRRLGIRFADELKWMPQNLTLRELTILGLSLRNGQTMAECALKIPESIAELTELLAKSSGVDAPKFKPWVEPVISAAKTRILLAVMAAAKPEAKVPPEYEDQQEDLPF